MSLSIFSKETLDYQEYKRSGGNSFVKLSDGMTNYTLSGNPHANHTVVLIHGGTIPLYIWDPQMDALLNSGHRILRYDQYGRGFSERPDTTYSRELFCRQLTELLDSLKITAPVDIIGPSFGGAIAVTFAHKYPQRVRSIMLISPALNVIGSESMLSGPLKLMRVPVIGTLAYKMIIKKKLVNRAISLIPGGKDSPCSTAFLNQFRCKGTDRALLSMFRSDAFGDYHVETKSTGISVKKLMLLRGESDKEITASMVDTTKNELQGCQFVELKNSGHSPGTSDADRLNKIIIDFLANN